MAVFGESTFLDRSGLGSDIPLNDVAGLSGANNSVWLMRVENSLSDLILTSKSDLRSSFKVR